MAWTKIGENLYMDTSTGAVGELKKNSGGGLFVADKGNYTGKYKKDTTPSYKKDTEVNKEINRNYNIASEYDKEAYELELKQRKEGRENGELTQKYRELEDLHKHKQNMAEDYRSYARKLENSRQRQTLNNEFGIGVKEEQLKNLKSAGNITKTPDNWREQLKKEKGPVYDKVKKYIDNNTPQKQLRESGVKTFADEIKEGNPIENMANKRIKEKNNTLNNDKIMLDYMKKKNIEEIQGMTQKDFENRISKNEKYLKTAGNITKAPEKISNPREVVNYHLKKGEFSKADKVMKDYGLEDEKDMFLEGQNYKVQADYKLYERKYNNLNEVIADRDSKLNRYINSKTPLEKMNRQQLAEYIVDDQISRGIVKEESRTMQVQGRLKGMGASKSMSKKELYLGAKNTQLSKMSLSELRKEAQKYNIDTTGLSEQKLRAKLIAIFK